MVEESITKDIAVIFEIEGLNEELEQLIPIKVVEGKYDKEKNTFESIEDGTVFEHIEVAQSNSCAFGNRTTLSVNEKITEEQFKEVMQSYLDFIDEFKYYRYVMSPEKMFISSPGEAMIPLHDIDGQYDKPEIAVGKPKEIEEKVKQTVKGQDEAIKKIVTSLWMTLTFARMTKKNMLVIGPSGVGKTIIFRKLQEILDVPLTIFSVPGLSQAGYAGRNTDEILKQIYFECGEDSELASNAIVILDEIDKLAYSTNKTGDISTSGVQNELLKIIEGTERTIELSPVGDYFDIDTSNMIFVGTGAFSELYEKEETKHIGFNEVKDSAKKDNKITPDKLIKYGLKRELLGRFPIIVELNPMTKDILKDIILNSDESEFMMTVESLQSLGVTIDNLDELIDIIADDAIALGIGARGLVTTINNIFLEIFYQVANNPNKYEKIIIGKNIIKNNKDFVLVPKKVKKRVKTVNKQ